MMMTSNTTQGTSTATVTTGTNFVADFTASTYAPSVHEAVSGSTTERIMIFMTANVSHTFTVPAGGLNCDILMIGGGGGGFTGGGGAGACIVAINKTLTAGSCTVIVGAGGSTGSRSAVNGGDSQIYFGGGEKFNARGGGAGAVDGGGGSGGGSGGGAGYGNTNGAVSGGAASGANVITFFNGTTGTASPSIYTTHLTAVLGNAGGNQEDTNSARYHGAGGGGIGFSGVSHPVGLQEGTAGGDGKYNVAIDGTTYNFRNYFANGGNSFGVLSGGNYYIGGGGGGYTDGGRTGSGNIGGLGGGGRGPTSGGSGNGVTDGTSNTGSGGGAKGATGTSSNGGSGIVIIRYRSGSITTTYTHTPTSTTTLTTTLGTPTIELIRGTQGDSNTDYKIGNYNGDFIVKSSTSNIDTDRFNITTAGNIGIGITNPAVKLQVVGGDFACSGDISAYYSDERLKTRLSNIKDPLEIIGKLNGFYYIPNDLARFYGITNMAQEIGLSAQEVNKVLPELVKIAPFDLSRDEDNNKISKSGENYLTLSYDRLAPVFVEAIKELRCSNDDLNEKYNRLLERFVNDEKL